MQLLTPPAPALVEAYQRMSPAGRPLATASIVGGSPALPVVRDGDRVTVLAQATGTLDEIVPALQQGWSYDPPPGTAEVWLALGGVAVTTPTTVRLGVRAVSYHDAIAATAGLSSGWRKAQADATRQVLQPLVIGDTVAIADLYADIDGERHDAADFIEQSGLVWSKPSGKLVYLLAEAGKGKSTLFGHAAVRGIESGAGPLPLYAPLRALPRGAGVSWGQIAREFGAVGTAADRLATAIRAGLVTPFLDGLDEVSGRYDPQIVTAVAEAIRKTLLGPHSRVFLSGRTTEATAFEDGSTIRVGVELPDTSEEAFEVYAERVTERVISEWGRLAKRVPEPTGLGLDVALARDTGEAPSHQQREDILRWVKASFDDLGKDRSLFFVQSLAFIARSYQLNGNRALVIDRPGAAPDEAKLAEANALDACLLAASLACAREQDKVDPIARELFTTEAQLDILTAFALMASAPSDLRAEFPQPTEIVGRCTGVNAASQLEHYVQMDRQMQKHALLIAQEGSVGDWTPAFLSDWIRSALLVRGWRCVSSGAPVAGLPPDLVRQSVAQAQRAHLVYDALLPEALQGSAGGGDALREALASAAADSPEAAANKVRLDSALHGEVHPAAPLPAFTNLIGLSADEADFRDLAASYLLASNSTFEGCSFVACDFDVCDFTDATFSNCTFEGVAFRECDGPVLFTGCSFASCVWADAKAPDRPVWTFVDSTFDAECQITQSVEVSTGDSLHNDVVSFKDCTCVGDPADLVAGSWSRSAAKPLEGIESEAVAKSRAPGELALRSVLRTFFTSWVGAGNVPQPRRYIRSSSLGRGAIPDGMPSNSALIDILYAEGFTDGGRDNHVYAPWSPVAGRTAAGLAMKASFIDYLVKGRRNEHVDRLQRRLERAAGWEPGSTR